MCIIDVPLSSLHPTELICLYKAVEKINGFEEQRRQILEATRAKIGTSKMFCIMSGIGNRMESLETDYKL